jgi:putative GTP pyrophosphokinase
MVSKESQERILSDYEVNEHLYAGFVNMLQSLLGSILRERGITVHSISGRPKSKKSLAGKLNKHSLNYEQLTDLTDLAGLRIITYFAEDVDRVAQAIEEEFAIDRVNSVDKRLSLEADRFGYLSMHHVLQLNEVRCSLTEHKMYKSMKAEVQTRSILQHAWAEIEHDLGYKSTVEVPQPIRRRFARIASLLELADDEFNGIKQDIHHYREELALALQNHQEDILLNLDSYQAFVESSELVRHLDKSIADNCNRELMIASVPGRNIFQKIKVFGIKTIAELSNALRDNESEVLRYADDWLHGTQGGMPLPMGISIYYLWLHLSSNKTDEEILWMLQASEDDSMPRGNENYQHNILNSMRKTCEKLRAQEYTSAPQNN